MRKALMAVALVTVVGGSALLVRQLRAGDDPSVTGELVETYCYASLRIGGPAHATCGIVCAKRGIPLAIIQQGTNKAFVLLPGVDKTGLPPQLVSEMGRKLKVHGDVVTRGGSSFLTVRSWERLD